MSEFPAATISELLSRAKTPGEFHSCLNTALEYFDRLNSQTIANASIRLACREGCSLCCWLRVDVFAHEVFLIAQYIHAHFTATETAELLSRLTSHSAKVLPLTPYEHATQNIPCPLLREGRCSVYSVRPQSCRRHHSQDFSACQFTYDHPADLEFPGAHDRDLFRTLTEAMQHGIDTYARLGFDDTIYELGTALAEVLADPTRWEHWRGNERAFLGAIVTPTG